MIHPFSRIRPSFWTLMDRFPVFCFLTFLDSSLSYCVRSQLHQATSKFLLNTEMSCCFKSQLCLLSSFYLLSTVPMEMLFAMASPLEWSQPPLSRKGFWAGAFAFLFKFIKTSSKTQRISSWKIASKYPSILKCVRAHPAMFAIPPRWLPWLSCRDLFTRGLGVHSLFHFKW